MRRKRVLVTGGEGFLGSHICDRLLADVGRARDLLESKPQVAFDDGLRTTIDYFRHQLGAR